MVSFQCEGCGDVQTKKKLDSHRNQCHAPFTCIDCMTTFHGSDYRAHTSCMTEDQKYQGHLYREKPTKAAKRKSVSILEPTENNALVPRKAYVEDEVEGDVPPAVPTPPPAVTSKASDSVFDYLVEEEGPNTPKITFSDGRGEMSMKNNAPPLFTSRSSSQNDYRNTEERRATQDYETNGFTYGAQPVIPRPSTDINASAISLDFMTPSAKATRAKLDRKDSDYSATHSRTNSNTEKKRKREQGDDVVMADVPETIVRQVVDTPGIVHSGLTGGLQRMVAGDDQLGYRSPESDTGPVREKSRGSRRSAKEEPQSPLKRTRRTKEDETGLGISVKGRAGRVKSMIEALNPNNAEGAMTKNRRRASSSEHTGSQTRGREGERRERKKHKVHRHNGTSRDNVRVEHHRSKRRGSDESPDESRRRPKAIEYHKNDYSNSDSEEDRRRGGESQMVVFGEEQRTQKKCEAFLSYVTKGPDSGKGYSINKTLKRWHRDNEVRSGTAKHEEEKDLWKGLRLKRNDRGEIVVFF